ncbi:MAG: thiamine diphosphokinase [Balneolaceae bacterium]
MNQKIVKAVILCDGRRPHAATIKKYIGKADIFIAADGGGNVAHSLGITPHIVIGDLDSYNFRGSDQVQIIRDDDQETNDLEKALKQVLKLKATDVTVFGAIGKRLDHTLKNLSVLSQFRQAFNSIVYKDKYGDLFLLPRNFRGKYTLGTIISLFPLSGIVENITTHGLQYSLKNESLEIGKRDGTSNKTAEPEIKITHEKGDLLIFIGKD